ncbi:class 1 fructose-bisphosphatase [Granulicoccus sp. GXG6511]|uniref:class 1 fructose-bisphosphatase n=1 Tax=Granulicoccus sp. GXG6511 TaxID=3381351 RepID=UPI003D7DC891
MLPEKSTLSQFLIETRRHHPEAVGDLNSLILEVALAVKRIAVRVAQNQFIGGASYGATNIQGEPQHRLDADANDILLRSTEWGGQTAGIVSEELAEPYRIPESYQRGKYLLCFDPLDGSGNIDVNLTVGTVFSVLRAPRPGEHATAEDFLQPGSRQIAAGYAVYGPATIFVLSVGTGVHGFTLDPTLGEFILTHPDIRIPASPNEFAINASNSRHWEPGVRRYVEECLAGTTGPRKANFNMRWIAACVGEAHRILMRGGVYLYPQDRKNAAQGGRLRLLYEANPLAWLIEQAGGRASTGRCRILDVEPTDIHQRVGLIFGDAAEVERIEEYHRDDPCSGNDECSGRDIPLYGSRGLFRSA